MPHLFQCKYGTSCPLRACAHPLQRTVDEIHRTSARASAKNANSTVRLFLMRFKLVNWYHWYCSSGKYCDIMLALAVAHAIDIINFRDTENLCALQIPLTKQMCWFSGRVSICCFLPFSDTSEAGYSQNWQICPLFISTENRLKDSSGLYSTAPHGARYQFSNHKIPQSPSFSHMTAQEFNASECCNTQTMTVSNE